MGILGRQAKERGETMGKRKKEKPGAPGIAGLVAQGLYGMAPWQNYCDQDTEREALSQMEMACRLPVAVRGALMPDAHLGYGIPIGGVLAARGAVIPYAVGADIACRMRLSVLERPPEHLSLKPQEYREALEGMTRFGLGASFQPGERLDHEVMEEDWGISPVTRKLFDKAWTQLGTSGSGNHFAEFGELSLERDCPDLSLAAGKYLALLTHSGSRGTGEEAASHYSALARYLRPDLPKELSYMAWLDLDSHPGREYWEVMQLMGRYASASHELIHQRVLKALKAEAISSVENHHNFAWEEEWEGETVVVHRKGATPAMEGVLGVVPGSMGDPGFVVKCKGNPLSLNSCSHGAGRRMSRNRAKASFNRRMVEDYLSERGVELITASCDEAPMAYKDIRKVMSLQSGLVEILARFDPLLVKMAPERERAERAHKKGKGRDFWD
jgi:tRNA-splicing ligase RtcB